MPTGKLEGFVLVLVLLMRMEYICTALEGSDSAKTCNISSRQTQWPPSRTLCILVFVNKTEKQKSRNLILTLQKNGFKVSIQNHIYLIPGLEEMSSITSLERLFFILFENNYQDVIPYNNLHVKRAGGGSGWQKN